jgi:hypothetical protein
MAGSLTISTLNNDTGVLATQNGMTGICKAWVNFDASSGTPSIRGSFNVSSVTTVGTGDFTVNYTTAMPNANYCVTGCIGNSSAGANAFIPTNAGSTAPATGSIRIGTYIYGAATNPTYAFVAVFSS